MALKRSQKDNTISSCKKLKAYNALEPDFINYKIVPSLESLSIVSIATALFKQSDIRGALQKHSMKYNPSAQTLPITNCMIGWTWTFRDFSGCNLYGCDESFYEIERKILDKLVSLPIPNILKVEVSNIVRYMQLQILEWIRKDRKDTEYIDSIFWSAEGTIDKIKTLKHLIHKETGQYVESTYKLACKYCLEESIHSLWNKLPETAKKDYLCSEKIYENSDNHLLAYWTYYISNDLSRFKEKIRRNNNRNLYNYNDSIYENMFKLALNKNNFLAVKYFWNKLTCVEVSSNLTHWIQLTVHTVRVACNSYEGLQENAISNILYFLLSKINSNAEQNEILQKNPDAVLKSLFFSIPSWQRFLLPTINLLWEHINEKVYVDLLKNITWEINEKTTTNLLFSRLWCDSPVNLKKHFIQEYVLNSSKNTNLFCNLLVAEKVGTIKAILEYANLQDQKKIMLLLVENENFFNVVHSDKLHLFDDLCLDILSQSDIKSIKDRIVCKHSNKTCQKWIESGKWDKVDGFLNWACNSQEQIKHFKNEKIKEVEITYFLLYHRRKYELANEFLSWYFDTEEEIHKFKIYFAKSKPEIIEIGSKDWHLFEKFVDWCFNSDEEIQNFKSELSQSGQIMDSVSYIAYDSKFDFIENVINWCFNSQEEIKEFKAILALSDTWMEILQIFVSDAIDEMACEWNNWELIKKLVKLVSPLDEDVIIKLKENIASVIDFNDYHGSYENGSVKVQKKDLFCLLDKDSYDIEYSDDEKSSDSEDEHNMSNCDTESEWVLTAVLNNPKSSLQADNN